MGAHPACAGPSAWHSCLPTPTGASPLADPDLDEMAKMGFIVAINGAAEQAWLDPNSGTFLGQRQKAISLRKEIDNREKRAQQRPAEPCNVETIEEAASGL